jgi:hypothetical protein
MADTVTLPGTGAVIASDDIGSAQYQRVKLTLLRAAEEVMSRWGVLTD